MAKQKVFVPIPVSERLPEGNDYVYVVSMTGACLIDCLPFEADVTHWLEEHELNVFTDEKLRTVLQAATCAEKITLQAQNIIEIFDQPNHDKS